MLIGTGLLLPLFAAAATLPEQALANLKRVRSFRYQLKMSRTEPPLVAGEFSGVVILPDTVEVTGSWFQQPEFQLKARGELQYLREKPDTQWSVQLRGEEADFITQVERALARDSFVSLGGNEYSFFPNVPFLDPLLNKQLTGRIRLRSDRILPEVITITSSDRVVFWEARFSDYDVVPPVSFPFVRKWRVALLPDDPSAPATADTAVIRDRLARLDRASQFELHSETLFVFLERELRDELLSTLVQPGEAGIWIARRQLVPGPLPPGARLFPLHADTAQKLLAEKLVLSRADWQGCAVIDTSPGPLLRLMLSKSGVSKLGQHKRLEQSGLFWALVLDSKVVALSRIGRRPGADRLLLEGLATLPAARAVKSILDSAVLTGRWRIVSQTPLR